MEHLSSKIKAPKLSSRAPWPHLLNESQQHSCSRHLTSTNSTVWLVLQGPFYAWIIIPITIWTCICHQRWAIPLLSVKRQFSRRQAQHGYTAESRRSRFFAKFAGRWIVLSTDRLTMVETCLKSWECWLKHVFKGVSILLGGELKPLLAPWGAPSSLQVFQGLADIPRGALPGEQAQLQRVMGTCGNLCIGWVIPCQPAWTNGPLFTRN